MLKRICLIAACAIYASLAQAEDFKCSAPSVVAALQGNLIAAASINVPALSNRVSLDDKDKALARKIRFADAEPIFTITEYIGKAEDESARSCTAKVQLSATNRKEATVQIEYEVLKTEDDKIIASGDLHGALRLLINEFDLLNGLYDALDSDDNVLSKGSTIGSAAETAARVRELSGDQTTGMPSTGYHSNFNR